MKGPEGRFHNPTEIHWMPWTRLGDLLPAEARRILLVHGRSSMGRVANRLEAEVLATRTVEVFRGVQPNPTAASVDTAVDRVREARPDWVVALGGGSVLDTSKAAAILAVHKHGTEAYLRGEATITRPGAPVLAVPTTAGTGSEVTPYASVIDEGERRKVSLTHDHLFPRIALLDPGLTITLPARETAASGMDALSHAVEAFWGRRATSVTDAFSLRAVGLVFRHLATAVTEPRVPEVRRGMLEASLLAGLAVSNARTTAVHAASYPLTVHFDVPHGVALALLLPAFVRFNADAVPRERAEELLDRTPGQSLEELADAIQELRDLSGLPGCLREVGVQKRDLDLLVEGSFRPDRVHNNPKPLTTEDLRRLLESIL